MLWKSRKFKDLIFDDKFQTKQQQELGYSYIIQSYTSDLATRTQDQLNANYHGGVLSNALYGIRFFNFMWVAIGRTKEHRGKVLEILQRNLSIEPWVNKNPYYDLSRFTDDNKKRTCKVMVSQSITKQHELEDYKFEYNFQLACPSEKIYGTVTKSEQIAKWFIGWVPLSTPLSTAIGSFGGGKEIENEGNRNAPVKIQIIGKCTNPKIYNVTTGQTLRISAITQNLIYDNRNLYFEEGKDWILKDLEIDITSKRKTGKDIYLAPWHNRIVVITDIPEEEPQIFITWRDTFNY